ncbi:MAG: hypothetical protein A2021_01805 [Elusimicrobia bacterium GWF2_52_66]|nr:MAG: hypothetical protein A2X33_04015 [Elusimicrobia bacterium GWA2_51_34]OGR84477.1 MAG: hypothetical protein A2021_01805 [Elusimicrobia bacterium GWF2_52_66]HAF96527.1 hypothetical protein [Elusimicrobiota bacterium]HCE97605.1 hypothetical protein [Elusimicrobiota bacterium]
MLKRKISLVLVSAALLCACGQPGVKKAHYKKSDTVYYLAPAQLALEQFPPPPLPGSNADKADIAAIRDWQQKRTQAECVRAGAAPDAYYSDFFGSVSPFPTPLPADAADFFNRVRADTDTAASVIKKRYQRPRPFRRDEGLTTCIDKAGGYSYPSGHAAISRMFALILSSLLPGRRAQFLARADEAALDRVISGVHHPSDIEAGKRLSDSLYAQLSGVPSFRRDIDALRRYLSH